MTEKIKKFFEERNIEYFASLSYSDCRVVAPKIMERENFSPKSVILFLLPYYAGETVNLSRYAASLDYHIAIREVTSELIALLNEMFPNSHSHGYGDHSPIDERHAAIIAGLGIKGYSGLLINEKYGTYIFIGDVITDIPPGQLGAIPPRPVRECVHCGSCRSHCPTGILRGEGKECLSAITQRKGELNEKEMELMRKFNTVWGCDECQRHCPYNLSPSITPLEFFHRERIPHLTRDILDSMDKTAFGARAFAWRGRRTVERNIDILEK